MDPKINFVVSDTGESKLERFLKSIQEYISPHDMKRLQAYTDNLADFHLVFFFWEGFLGEGSSLFVIEIWELYCGYVSS